MDRRSFLQRSGAAALAFGILRHPACAASGDPFTLGIASGDPAPDGFILWTRLATSPLAADGQGGMGGPVQVTWEVAEDDGLARVVASGTAEANAQWAHSVHAEVGGLKPDRPYWYRFTALGQRSAIGRARTAPAFDASPSRLRFAFASCSNWQMGHFSAYRHMAAENPDLVLFLGDYIYEVTYPAGAGGRVMRPHDGPTAVDLTGYRNRYALYRTDPDLQALHAAAPCLVTWDDHEVENDYADQWSERMEVTPEAFLKRRAAAYRAYYEHMPVRRRAVPNGSAMQLFERVRFGDLATFAVLDGRQYRTKQPCEVPPSRRGHLAPESCLERIELNRSYLGREQERWLLDGLKKNEAAWHVMAQGQLIAELRQKDKTGATAYWTESWEGYPAARQRMLDAIASTKPANPVFLGGDIHSFWTTDLKTDFRNPQSATVATEFVGTSVTSDPPPPGVIEAVLPDNPHIKYFEGRYRGYVSVDVTRERMETRLQAISDRRDPKATVSRLKTFVIESGKAGAVAT
jgi:alkaline phosphatase D